jgi:hypothetical protein
MQQFEWRPFLPGDAGPLAALFRDAVAQLAAADDVGASAKRSFERAGFGVLAQERVERNGVSLSRFRMLKPLAAAHIPE